MNRTTLRSAPGGVRNGLKPVDGAPGAVFWFQKTPSCRREKPQLRPAMKNHTRSRRIGPPRLSDWSHIFSVLFDRFRPRARRSAVRFSLSMPSLEKKPAATPLNWLPPSLGMMFTTGPSAFTSAPMPLVWSTISSIAAALIW